MGLLDGLFVLRLWAGHLARVRRAGHHLAPMAAVALPAPKQPALRMSTLALMVVLPAVIGASLSAMQQNIPLWVTRAILLLRALLRGKQYTRTIEFKTRFNQWGYVISDR